MLKTDKPPEITLLDGGMGREIERLGAPFRQPEWSALALMEAPEIVQKVHESFLDAGSDIITTSNYAVVPYHIGNQRFHSQGAQLTELSGKLAREAAAATGKKVAGSLPPLFGSYRPDLFIKEQAPPLLKVIIDALRPHVDIWLAETVSSIEEAQTVVQALHGDHRPLWISFSLMDNEHANNDTPRLRSGETVKDAIDSIVGAGISAILFNCSQPEVMASAVELTAHKIEQLQEDIAVGVYANAFSSQRKNSQANLTLNTIRQNLDPLEYLSYAKTWQQLGATIIGGCCGIGPEYIATLSENLKTQ